MYVAILFMKKRYNKKQSLQGDLLLMSFIWYGKLFIEFVHIHNITTCVRDIGIRCLTERISHQLGASPGIKFHEYVIHNGILTCLRISFQSLKKKKSI